MRAEGIVLDFNTKKKYLEDKHKKLVEYFIYVKSKDEDDEAFIDLLKEFYKNAVKHLPKEGFKKKRRIAAKQSNEKKITQIKPKKQEEKKVEEKVLKNEKQQEIEIKMTNESSVSDRMTSI